MTQHPYKVELVEHKSGFDIHVLLSAVIWCEKNFDKGHWDYDGKLTFYFLHMEDMVKFKLACM